MLLLWLFEVLDTKGAKFEDSITIIRRSLEFMGPRTDTAGASDVCEEISSKGKG